MSSFHVNIDKTIKTSQEFLTIAGNLASIEEKLNQLKLTGFLSTSSEKNIENSLRILRENVSDEAAKAKSLSDALQTVIRQYQKAEDSIIGELELAGFGESAVGATFTGTDKRKWWSKFWDWVTKKEPDKYDTTDREQEKAADAAIKRGLYAVLQNKKYSRENWDKSTVEERKQILQDYMNEAIKVYGLKNVRSKIRWDSKAEYSPDYITWGSYRNFTHTVTLNARALTDSVGSWDSYELLETIGHELRHAYQHEAVSHPTRFMVSQETIDTWRKNFRHYISSDQNYDAYRAQAVEVDARNFEINRRSF